jgi:hypothetical protein
MVQNRFSFYDFNSCSWDGYTNVNDVVIFIIIINNSRIAKLDYMNFNDQVIVNKSIFLHYSLGVNFGLEI